MNKDEYFENLVSISLDGTLTDAEREKLAACLADDPSYVRLQQELEQMQSLLQDLPEFPETLHGDIMRRVEQEARLTVVQPEKPARRLPVFTMVAAAAIVVLAVLGGGLGEMFNMVAVGNGAGSSGGSMASTDTTEGMTALTDELENEIAGSMDNRSDAGSATAATGGAAEQKQNSGRARMSEDNGNDNGEENGLMTDYIETEEPSLFMAEPEDTPAAPDSPEEADSTETSDYAVLDRAAVQENSAEPKQQSVTLPESLLHTSVAHCYLAEGTGELPNIAGELLLHENGVSYFSLPNNMSTIEETLAAVEQAGYQVSAYESVGLTIDSKASTWMLIVSETPQE